MQQFSASLRLFDHLVGLRQQSWWHSEAEGLSGPEVEDKLVFSRQFDRQLARFCSFENAAHVDAASARGIDRAGSVAHQPAHLNKLTPLVGCRQCMAVRKCDELTALADINSTGADE